MKLEALLESILFFKGEPISVDELASLTESKKQDVLDAIVLLEKNLEGRGVKLLREGQEFELRTDPEATEVIENLIKKERSRDLGKAGLETMAIILYEGPVSRKKIDYIRGVNSSFIIRNLLIRGLITRIPHPDDKRSFAYKETPEFIAHLGITEKSDLPNFEKIREELQNFNQNNPEEESADLTNPDLENQ
ncbi:MAG: SMC-Scp complex subunit ScpB [Parcubacteria group bacterium CG11_big_fil_rev_8_21_14_0_20_39_22]|nr:MAG: SMC-Scp complex subunit ScpB [Parcubacteria group bacterium CG11_big_fil_rev_8_21_14_0_20_39_22]